MRAAIASRRRLAGLFASALLLAGPASAQDRQGGSAVPGLSASGTPVPCGRPAIEGYIVSDSGRWFRRVILRVEALDPSGGVTASGIAHVDPPIPPGSHVYFMAPAPAAAGAYRLTVLSAEGFGGASGP